MFCKKVASTNYAGVALNLNWLILANNFSILSKSSFVYVGHCGLQQLLLRL